MFIIQKLIMKNDLIVFAGHFTPNSFITLLTQGNCTKNVILAKMNGFTPPLTSTGSAYPWCQGGE
jgi:hypothetical protein